MPSSPASIPSPRKTSSIGAPTRREISPARMLNIPSAPPSRISSCALSKAACPSAINWALVTGKIS